MNNNHTNSILRNILDHNNELVQQFGREYFCIICQKILVNSHSAPCGCRYCYHCIENYLLGSDGYCPGNSEDCKQQIISCRSNVFIDHAANRKISKLIVKCPEPFCSQQVELRKMEDHMRWCNSESDECPFASAGCNETKLPKNKMNDHLKNENFTHLKLLMECISHLKNEIEMGKRQNLVSTAENQGLKEEIQFLRVHLSEQETKIHGLEEKGQETRSKLVLLEEKMRRMESKFNSHEQIRNNPISSTVSTQSSHVVPIQQETSFETFEWKIDNFSSKKLDAEMDIITELYSEPFYTHEKGYKLCLRIDLDGTGTRKHYYLALYFCLMRGPHDDHLSWPFRHHVTFELINQRSGLVHARSTIQCDEYSNYGEIDKPSVDRNNGFGFPKFLALDELMSNDDLVLNNQLIIRCISKMP